MLVKQTQKNLDNPETSIWKNAQFLLLWVGNSLSRCTYAIFTIGLPLIIYDLTSSSSSMAIMRAVEFLPNLLLAIVIGTIIDKYNRKRILITSITIQSFVLLTLIILLISNLINLGFLYLICFVLFTLNYTSGNVYHALIPKIVNKNQLIEANSAISFINSLIRIISPALAGLILLLTSYTIGLSITLLGLILMLILSSLIKYSHEESKDTKDKLFWDDMKKGWYILIEDKPLLNLTFFVLISNIAASISFAVLFYYALDSLHLEESKIGIILAASAIGGVLSALFVKNLNIIIGTKALIISSVFIDTISYLIMFLSSNWLMLALGLFINGVSTGIINIIYSSVRQYNTPNEYLGRVAGTTSTIMKLVLPLSFISAGFFSELITVKYLFLVSSIISSFLILYIVSIKIPELVSK